VTTQVIILNGTSSSGKSSIVRSLQSLLPDPWLAFGIDGFVETLPAKLFSMESGIEFATDGTVSVGADFRTLEAAWMAGVAATARAGAKVVIDDVFLGGAASQQRWEHALGDLEVLWVGVRCDIAITEERERMRGNRSQGMAAQQAEVVHVGVHYDLEVDTSHTESLDCARTIAARLN
jgi:chloramphenicol 3-O phosphotransferase